MMVPWMSHGDPIWTHDLWRPWKDLCGRFGTTWEPIGRMGALVNTSKPARRVRGLLNNCSWKPVWKACHCKTKSNRVKWRSHRVKSRSQSRQKAFDSRQILFQSRLIPSNRVSIASNRVKSSQIVSKSRQRFHTIYSEYAILREPSWKRDE